MYGDVHAMAGRRHDQTVLNNSNLETKMQIAQVGQPLKFKPHSDRAYQTSRMMWASHKGFHNLALWQLIENYVMKKHRIGVEWGFGEVVNLSAYLAFGKSLHIRSQAITKYIIVGFLIANTHTCLYGNQATTYWDCSPPSLEDYFS